MRIGHRRKRDARATTHVCLAARALGAERAIVCGEDDEKLVSGVNDVAKRWGGKFRAKIGKGWKPEITKLKGQGFPIVHLTMYGIPFENKLGELKKRRKLAIVVGSEKVPGEVYRLADYNLSVTSQPHSEVAALAILLHSLRIKPDFAGSKLRVIPQERGKRILE